MENKICIITATFNSSKTISDTIESILKQDYKNFHHLIIDGNSSDNTLEIIDSYKCENITVISEGDNGIYDAMNKGLLNANGDIVGFLNSDDMYSNDRVLSNTSSCYNSQCRCILETFNRYTCYANWRICG